MVHGLAETASSSAIQQPCSIPRARSRLIQSTSGRGVMMPDRQIRRGVILAVGTDGYFNLMAKLMGNLAPAWAADSPMLARSADARARSKDRHPSPVFCQFVPDRASSAIRISARVLNSPSWYFSR